MYFYHKLLCSIILVVVVVLLFIIAGRGIWHAKSLLLQHSVGQLLQVLGQFSCTANSPRSLSGSSHLRLGLLATQRQVRFVLPLIKYVAESAQSEHVGVFVGLDDGELVGLIIGASVGLDDGELVGLIVGASVGLGVGESVGLSVGESVGLFVGETVGLFDGEIVGLGVGE